MEQSNFENEEKDKLNMVNNYKMDCNCGYEEESFIHKLLFCKESERKAINLKRFLQIGEKFFCVGEKKVKL